jgi:hypothetical protein
MGERPWIGGRLDSRVRISPGSYAGLINRVNLRPLPEVLDHWSVVEKFIRNNSKRVNLRALRARPSARRSAAPVMLRLAAHAPSDYAAAKRCSRFSVRAGALRWIRS